MFESLIGEQMNSGNLHAEPVVELNSVTVRYDNVRFIDKILKPKETARPAVDRVSLSVLPEKVLGLVGESGCGKSTIAKSILMLADLTGGSIKFQQKDKEYWERHRKQFYSKIQMIWQDPFSSLNTKMRVREIISRPLINFYSPSRRETADRVAEILHLVGLSNDHLNMYPHELSGGGRQRVTIARALICNPVLLLADEPTSALDVSIQAQILNLLKNLQKEMQLTMLMISHNLSVVHFLCDRIAVMYAGKIIETSDRDSVFNRHRHWYTKLLYESVPTGTKQREREFAVDLGELQVSRRGCPFAIRCIRAEEKCHAEEPELKQLSEGHFCACHFPISR